MSDSREHEIMFKAEQLLNEALAFELKAQGHFLTGSLERSLKGTVAGSQNQVVLRGYALRYAEDLQKGVPPERIPFTDTDDSRYSYYVQKLTRYFILRGLPEAEAKRAAARTAKAHKREGMPTSGSYQYSQTGERTKFIDSADEQVSPVLNHMVLGAYDKMVDQHFHETKSETI